MAFHVSNGHLRTSNKGLVTTKFSMAIGATGAVGTIYQAGANFVLSATRASAGVYNFVLNKPYPIRLVFASAILSTPGVTNALAVARFDADSYSATAGTFTVNISIPTAAGNTAQIAGDATDGAILNVELSYVDQTTGIAN